ncbi:GNAT family N-acetyltransferase [Psychrobacillus sp. NEAU-3TGS]|uniref:GNAT family N-acetyltransferase n=1 Tax=Psychrobacillus sp. NEAU-3TGS TaxID=2995412 RepID=UPI00249772C6|nr:GNAT family N-acetyltransferase [Psychrobacillus sp. NEAU-3TGS]MDI2588727.1 GNAT family N-acetyltransferase [Psychrobacillus sp. NEAU-3TGS]
MQFHITKETDKESVKYINNELYQYNLKHFPEDLRGRYKEINLFVRDENDHVCGGLIGEICWNWLEIQILMVNEDLRKSGLGTKLLLEAEQVARDNQCDFIKLDTLSFQALDFYQKHGYEVYGSINNVGREHMHHYLKKDLK